MNYRYHKKKCKGKPILVAKTYRQYERDIMDGNLYEITEYLFKCDECGATWKETLNGKEEKICQYTKIL